MSLYINESSCTNYSENLSPPRSPLQYLPYFLLLWLLSVSGVILNGIELYILKRRKSLWSSNDVLLVSLSIADILYLLFKPTSVTLLFLGHTFELLRALNMGFIVNSVLHLFAMAIDRFLCVRTPFWHRVNITPEHITKACLSIWLLTFSLLAALGVSGIFAYINLIAVYGLLYKIAIIWTGLTFITCYSYIAMKSFVRRGSAENNSTPLSCHIIRPNWKTAQRSALITITFLLLHLPTVIGHIFGYTAVYWFYLLGILNASLNSIIFFFLPNRNRPQRSFCSRRSTSAAVISTPERICIKTILDSKVQDF